MAQQLLDHTDPAMRVGDQIEKIASMLLKLRILGELHQAAKAEHPGKEPARAFAHQGTV
jgi:hypothetical protein